MDTEHAIGSAIHPTEADKQLGNPKPSVDDLSELANRVLTGDIILPKFQRDFVWSPEQVLGLLDSIARNYPIGSILLWRSKMRLRSERNIAGLEIADRDPEYPVNYLLDGQQRLSTICGAYYWRAPDEQSAASIWNIIYDLESRNFRHVEQIETPLHHIPLRLMSDPAAYFHRASAIADRAHFDRAHELFNTFSRYKVPGVRVPDLPIEAIGVIFERVNSTGTPLTIVDLMRAATWTPEFDIVEQIDGLLDTLRVHGYGTIDRKTVLRAVSAAADHGFAVDDIERLRNLKPDTINGHLEEVRRASALAVDFLKKQIGAPYPISLPYVNQFAVLVDLFRLIPRPLDNELRTIEHWFWRTSLTSHFKGWNTGQMARDAQRNKEYSRTRKPDDLLPDGLIPRARSWADGQFRANSAMAKMLALMMAQSKPEDLLTGHAIDLGPSLSWQNYREFHHLFPKDYLRAEGVPAGMINSACNFIVLSADSNNRISNRPPSDYLQEAVDNVGYETIVARAKKLLVSEEALVAAFGDDYEAFLRIRSSDLSRAAMRLSGITQEEIAGVGH